MVLLHQNMALLLSEAFSGGHPIGLRLVGLIWMVLAGTQACSQQRLHVDEIILEGRFVKMRTADSAEGEEVYFDGVLFDEWPNGSLKSECTIQEGQWNYDCKEWHPNGQLRSSEELDPPYFIWTGYYANGALFFKRVYAFEPPAGPSLGIGEELQSTCFSNKGEEVPCLEDVVWPD